MSRLIKSESELIAIARAELKVHADCPDGMTISILRDGDSWGVPSECRPSNVGQAGLP
jgi:hypothetical protein